MSFWAIGSRRLRFELQVGMLSPATDGAPMNSTRHISDQEDRRGRPVGLLRPSDQLSIAVLTAVALLCMLAWWAWHGGPAGQLVDIDQVAPQQVRFLVDVNTAEWPELVQVPGIGRVLARRIVRWREEHGPFRSADELLRIQGIGPRTLERIRPYLLPIESAADDSADVHSTK